MSSARSGSGKPTRRSMSAVSARSRLAVVSLCSRSASETWSPTVCSGESEVIGSWKMIETAPPRSRRIRRLSGSSAAMSTSGRPSRRRRIEPERMAAARGRMPMTACAVTDLPDPDSPTSATVRPCGTEKDTPSTAVTAPPGVLNSIARFSISSSALNARTSLRRRSTPRLEIDWPDAERLQIGERRGIGRQRIFPPPPARPARLRG